MKSRFAPKHIYPETHGEMISCLWAVTRTERQICIYDESYETALLIFGVEHVRGRNDFVSYQFWIQWFKLKQKTFKKVLWKSVGGKKRNDFVLWGKTKVGEMISLNRVMG